MDSCKRQLGGRLSAGQLMRLASQVSQHPAELMSLTAAERMWDLPEPQSGGLWASPSPLLMARSKRSSPVGSGASGSESSPAAAKSSTLLPLRRRMVWSQEEFDIPGASRHDRGVSSCIKQENSSQQEASAKLDSSQATHSKKITPSSSRLNATLVDSPSSRKQTINMIEAKFRDEVAAMENQMADLGKSLQMKRYDKENPEAKANEDREAEKRRREAEVRKARMKEKDARDPHRKVKLRLENARRFEMEMLDDAEIPTVDVNFEGRGGNEKMRLVDVQALRSRCQGLKEGIHSVPKLVELQQRKDNSFHHSSTRVSGNMMMSTSMPNFSSDTIASEGPIQPMRLNCNDRYQRFGEQRRQLTSENGSRRGSPL